MIIYDVKQHPFFKIGMAPKRVLEYIRYSVKPTHRYFEAGSWNLHKDFLGNIVQIAAASGEYTDYSSLPDEIQIEIAFVKANHALPNAAKPEDGPTPLTDRYAELHLLPTAPESVVKASYKALVLIHHPDKGGSAEQFTRITEAYQALIKED